TIRNLLLQESEDSIRTLVTERDEVERERWNLLKHARDESERSVSLSAQIGLKDATIRQLQEELGELRRRVSLSRGPSVSESAAGDAAIGNGERRSPGAIASDEESVGSRRSNVSASHSRRQGSAGGRVTPSAVGGRGSSDRDSGVRGSSDRDSLSAQNNSSDSPSASQEGPNGTSPGVHSAPSASSKSRPPGGHYAAPYYCPTPPSYQNTQTYRRIRPSLLYASVMTTTSSSPSGVRDRLPVPSSIGMSSLSIRSGSGGILSRSAEHIYCAPFSTLGHDPKKKRRPLANLGMKAPWGSISRAFSRATKQLQAAHRSSSKLQFDPSLFETAPFTDTGSDRQSWSPRSSICTSPLREGLEGLGGGYSEKLHLLEEAQQTPLELWRAPTIQAWMELSLGMPQYAVIVAENVKSGKVLLELSDGDLENGLGISLPMHRRKLRLAIEEHRCPSLVRYPNIAKLGHAWVAMEWLRDLGLTQYSEVFAYHLVDARMLEHLTKREVEKHLGINRKFHQASIFHSVYLLRMIQYDVVALAERRRATEDALEDPLVWTNEKVMRWARSIDLHEYAENLRESGVHGALMVLETSFNGDTFANALNIPTSKSILRRHLSQEFDSIVLPARHRLEQDLRRLKEERRRIEKLGGGGGGTLTSAGVALGRNFSRSFTGGLQSSANSSFSEKDSIKSGQSGRSGLRGSIGRRLGQRLKQEFLRYSSPPSLDDQLTPGDDDPYEPCDPFDTPRSPTSLAPPPAPAPAPPQTASNATLTGNDDSETDESVGSSRRSSSRGRCRADVDPTVLTITPV
ncbi:unnamed protein product, partial [Cyprideis torosa]